MIYVINLYVIFVFQSACPSVYRKIYTPILYSPVYTEDVRWNYEKFLIGPDGRPIYRYAQTVDPATDTQFLSDIKVELSKLQANAHTSGGASSHGGPGVLG